MALTIEDGSGVAGADSFLSAQDAATREGLFFGDATILDDPSGEAALRRAWVYMSGLDWKANTWASFEGEIPDAVKTAQVVLARAEFASTGVLSPSVSLSVRRVLSKAGDIAWNTPATPSSVKDFRPVVTMAFDLLKPYLEKSALNEGGTRELLRS
jgi:hypothetical protein